MRGDGWTPVLPGRTGGTGGGVDAVIIDGDDVHAVQVKGPEPGRWLIGDPGPGEDDATAAVRAWLLSYGSEDTRRSYQRAIGLWLAFCAASELAPLRAERMHVDAFARGLERHYPNARTRAARISAVSSFYRYCARTDRLSANPVQYVERPVKPGVSTRWLTLDEATALLEAVDADATGDQAERGIMYAAVLRTSLELVLRVKETCGLDRADRKLIGGQWRLIVRRKGGREYAEPVPEPLDAALMRWLAVSGESLPVPHAYTGGPYRSPMFTLPRGSNGPERQSRGPRLTREAYRTRLVAYARDAGLDDPESVTPHVLRHTGLTLAAEAVSVPRLVQLARHRDPALTLAVYVHEGPSSGHAGHVLGDLLG